jgi:hypothetical protein
MSQRPVSKVCPACGATGYKRREPDQWVASVSDRDCRACHTLNTPPTPSWAALTFVLVGIVMLLGGHAAST